MTRAVAATFQLMYDPKQVDAISSSSIARSLYEVMEKMRRVALDHAASWTEYPTLQDYAKICFWAIRKLEYGFIAEQFVALEKKYNRPLRVLDVGCGVVPLNNWLERRGHIVTAFDPLYEDIEFLVKNDLNAFYGSNVQYLTALGEHLPFPDNWFDVIVSASVLEHTIPGNDRVIMDEIARVLKLDGHLLITFDVSPPQSLQEGESALPVGLRRFGYPFQPDAVRNLFSWLSRYFMIAAKEVPPILDKIAWKHIHLFWRTMQEHDGREAETRDYLALGAVIPRNGRAFQQNSAEILRAYREGQSSLVQQLSFNIYHANRRLDVIRDLQDGLQKFKDATLTAHHNFNLEIRELSGRMRDLLIENRKLQAQLIEKEKIVENFRKSIFYGFVNGPFRILPFFGVLHSLATHFRDVRRVFLPKVGVLEQHDPMPLRIPGQNRIPLSIDPALAPRISIVTPSYNQAAFIERTVKSVLDQGYPNLEYVVQDGGSTDGTVEVMNPYLEKLTHFDSHKDKGQAHAINLGIQHTSGEIMAYLNSDDILLPGCLNYVADYFARHPDVDVIYSHRVVINEKDEEIGHWILPRHDHEVILWADFVPQETLFWRRSVWEKAGNQMDESYQFALDWDMLVRFRAAGAKFVRVPRFLAAFRVQSAQKTSMHMNSTGLAEMNRLRRQLHNREIGWEEVLKNIKPYLNRSILYHKLHWLGLLRY